MAKTKLSSVKISTTLPVFIFREDDAFVAYTPWLDLSTAGGTFEEANSNLSEAVRLFLEETDAMGTLPTVLRGLGWKESNGKFSAPIMIGHGTESVSYPLAHACA